MIKVLISGCSGKMGHVVADCIKQRNDCKVVAGVDIHNEVYDHFPIFRTFAECTVKADVVIDFSNPENLSNLLLYGSNTQTPLVIATTGYTNQQLRQIQMVSTKVAVFFSFNMSLGVNLMVELAKKATNVLGGQYDIEIIEKHHNQKVDAPSGTAIMLAEAVNKEMNNQMEFVFDRHRSHNKRKKKEIGMHSIRGGTIVGEHEIVFAGRDEILSICHRAQSKEIFAVGAVNAAIFLANQPIGLYNMGNLV